MNEPSGKKPLAVYAVLERKEGQKPFWLKVGAAFTNRDDSLTVVLDAFPTGTNRLQIREQREWEPRPAGANGSEAHP
jgi:O-succinylbenzoate synthase